MFIENLTKVNIEFWIIGVPAKSKAQFRKIAQLIKEGKIPRSRKAEWLSVSYESLPGKVRKKKGRKRGK